jgi:geranylgeranyl pyrophosphate synthase
MQLNDDLRDLSTGSVVNDLKTGYYSLPVLQALTQTNHVHHAHLSQLLAAEPLSDPIITEIVDILAEMGAFSLALSMAHVYRQKALQCLQSFPPENVVYLQDFLERFLKIETQQV